MNVFNSLLTEKWAVMHNKNDKYYTAKITPQDNFKTQQPIVELFNSEEELLSAYPQLSSHPVEPPF